MTDFMHITYTTKGILNFLTNLTSKLYGFESGKALTPLYIVSRVSKMDSIRSSKS